jgi:hypothetical protein
MDKYLELRTNSPKLSISGGAREVIFKTISCMCDNVGYLKFKKNGEGDFKMSGNGFSLSNWQFKYQVHEIEWAADEEGWDEAIKMINSGTSLIESVTSR